MRRLRGTSPCFKLPFTPTHLLALRNCLNLNSAPDSLFFAVLCSFGLLRIGNVLAGSPGSVHNVVTSADLQFLPKGAVLRISASKTIQFRERVHSAVLPLFPLHPLCPVTALRNFLLLAGAGPKSPASPLFALPSAPPLTARSFRLRLAGLLASLHLSQSDFSTHSLRRGGATWLLNAGTPIHLIKILGDWKSDCVLQYLRPSPSDRLLTLTTVPLT